MGDRIGVQLQLRSICLSLTNHPGQLSLSIPPWVGAMSTGQRVVMLCHWGVKADMVLFAGNTVWSISERIRGICMYALYKSTFTLLYFTKTSVDNVAQRARPMGRFEVDSSQLVHLWSPQRDRWTDITWEIQTDIISVLTLSTAFRLFVCYCWHLSGCIIRFRRSGWESHHDSERCVYKFGTSTSGKPGKFSFLCIRFFIVLALFLLAILR